MGKCLIMVTTWATWYVGIVAINSDYAFLVTNVVIHGIPYLILFYWYGWMRGKGGTGLQPVKRVSRVRTIGLFIATVWVLRPHSGLLATLKCEISTGIPASRPI